MKTIRLKDGRELSYELTRKRVKNINFRVKPGNVVLVSANSRVSVKEIEQVLESHAEFFFRAFGRVNAREGHNMFGTERIRWLGSEYPVRVIKSSRERAVIDESECRVFTLETDEQYISGLIRKTVAERFLELCRELNEEVRSSLKEKGFNPPPTQITVKDMKTRWGSCSYNRGHISINIRLAEYPRETVLSVFWHEYAHYWHHDHSKAFYDFLESMYPDYRAHNGILNKD